MTKTKRKYLTPKQKVYKLNEQGNVCAECGGDFWILDPAVFDHHQALIDGGHNTWDNWRAIHREICHKPKTKIEQQNIAKTRRIHKKAAGRKKKWQKKIENKKTNWPKQQIRGRGFDKTIKRKIQTKSKGFL